jgi:hypothetical protein
MRYRNSFPYLSPSFFRRSEELYHESCILSSIILDQSKQKNASGFYSGGIAYETSAAGIGIAAAGIAAAVPTVIAVSAAAAAPDNNQ